VVIHKVALATPAAVLEELVGREQAVLDRFGVELHLVARDRVDQRADHLVERVDEEGHVQDQRRAQALWIVRLEDVQHLDGPRPVRISINERATRARRLAYKKDCVPI